MNKLQLTKGELTKIILEEVRGLQEQEDLDKASAEAATKELEKRMKEDPTIPAKLLAVLEEMDKYE